jgi:hypothetical protein
MAAFFAPDSACRAYSEEPWLHGNRKIVENIETGETVGYRKVDRSSSCCWIRFVCWIGSDLATTINNQTGCGLLAESSTVPVVSSGRTRYTIVSVTLVQKLCMSDDWWVMSDEWWGVIQNEFPNASHNTQYYCFVKIKHVQRAKTTGWKRRSRLPGLFPLWWWRNVHEYHERKISIF